jgi:hypothetical protein
VKHLTLLPDFNQVSQRSPVLNIMEIFPVGSRADTRGWTDGQMERKQKDGHYDDDRCLSPL